MASTRNQLSKKLLLSAILTMVASNVFAQKEHRDTKKTAFAQLNASFLSTASGTPFLLNHFQFKGTNEIIKFTKKFTLTTLCNSQENFGVLKKDILGYGSFTKGTLLYKNSRNSIGEGISSFLKLVRILPNRSVTKSPLLEAYEKNVPMFWHLRNVEDVRTFAECMSLLVAKKYEDTTHNKPILVLTIENDPELTTLNSADKALINKLFTRMSLTDKDVQTFFEAMQKNMYKENYKLNSCGDRVPRPYETFTEKLFAKVEKTCKNWETKKFVAVALAIAATSFIKEPVMSNLKKLITQAKVKMKLA